jgi:hypothetical protein
MGPRIRCLARATVLVPLALVGAGLVMAGTAGAQTDGVIVTSMCWTSDTNHIWRFSNSSAAEISGTLGGRLSGPLTVPARSDVYRSMAGTRGGGAQNVSFTPTGGSASLRASNAQFCTFHVTPVITWPGAPPADETTFRLVLQSAIETVTYRWNGGALVAISESPRGQAALFQRETGRLDVQAGGSYTVEAQEVPAPYTLGDDIGSASAPLFAFLPDAQAFGVWFFGLPPRTGQDAAKQQRLPLTAGVIPETTTTTTTVPPTTVPPTTVPTTTELTTTTEPTTSTTDSIVPTVLPTVVEPSSTTAAASTTTDAGGGLATTSTSGAPRPTAVTPTSELPFTGPTPGGDASGAAAGVLFIAAGGTCAAASFVVRRRQRPVR